MNQDNRPPYQMPQMAPGQPPQPQMQNAPPQPQYNMYEQQNTGMDYGRSGHLQDNRGQPNIGMQPGQSYQGYSQAPQTAQPPIAGQNMQGYNYRQEGGNVGGYSQVNPGGSQQPDRMQNYNSFHETSAPIGGNMGMNQYPPKQNEYSTQHERSIGPGTQLFRSDSGMQQYPPSGMPDMRGQSQYSGLGQGSNQAPPQMPGQSMYPQPSGIDAGGMHTGSQSFHLGGDMGGAGALPQISMGGSQQMMGMGGVGQGKTDPSSMDISTLNRMAEYYATNSDYPKAIEYFEKMTNICRENGHAWTALGHCYLLKEDLHKSFQAYQNALYYLENIMDPQLWYGIGILYEKFESYEHAISSLMAVLKMSPNFYQKSEVLSRLGYIFAKTNDLPNAITYFQNSILTNTFTPKRKAEILIKIGILHEERNEFLQSQKSYETALSLDDGNYILYQHLAWNQYLQGNQAAAMEYANKAEEGNPENLDTLYVKARINQQIGLHDEASRIYHQIIQKNPNSALYWCSLAVLNYEQNLCEQAFEKIISATKLNGTMVESWYNFGVLYEKCKQSDEAVVAYKKALEIEPEDQDARARLLSIQSPMYNADNTSMLYMKFPAFRIPNNLVIDRKYKKPQNQRGLQSQMQNVGGMMSGMSQLGGEPAPQYMGASTSSTQIPGLNQVSGIGQYQSSIPQQYEEEKRYNPAPSQYPPQIQPQNVSGGSMSTPYPVQSQPQPYQATQSAPSQIQPNYNQNNPRGSNNSSYNHTYGMNNQNYDMNAGRQAPTQPQAYGAVQDPQRNPQPNIPYGVENIQGYPPQNQQQNKIVKVEEYGPGQQANPASYQQHSDPQSHNASYQAPSRDPIQSAPPLNQVAQTLNTQPNMPSLQSSVNQPSSQIYAPQPQYNQSQPQYNQGQPQYNQTQPQYNQSQPQYNQTQQPYNQYQGQYNQPQSQSNQPVVQPAPQPVQQPTQYSQPQYPQNTQYNQTQPQYTQPAQNQYQGGYPQTAQPVQPAPLSQPPVQAPVLPQNQSMNQPAHTSGQMTPQSMQNYPPQDNFQNQSNLVYQNQQPQGINPTGMPMGGPQNLQDQYAAQPQMMNQPLNQQLSQPMSQPMAQQLNQPILNTLPQIPLSVTVPVQNRIDESKGEHESSARSHSQIHESQRMQGTPTNQNQEMVDDNAQAAAAGTEDTHEQILNNTVFQPHPEIGGHSEQPNQEQIQPSQVEQTPDNVNS